MAGKPTPAFFVVLAIVVLGLIGFAVYRSLDIVAPKAAQKTADQGDIDPSKLGVPPANGGAEAQDTTGITTVSEYKIKPSERLPPVQGTAAYEPLQDNTVKFALNVWAGWAPIIYANDGFRANKVWKTPDGQDFKVQLELIDNPIDMRNAYATGSVHIGWATLDMVPLFIDGFVKADGSPVDSRVMPRIADLSAN
jgi:hypothetical protein